MSALPSNFNSLPPLEKRAAVERATGLSWEEYSKLPGLQQTAMLLSLQGITIQSTAGDMLSAAKKDSFWSGVGGYVSGMGAGLKIALLLGIVAMVWIFLPSLKRLPRLTRSAA